MKLSFARRLFGLLLVCGLLSACGSSGKTLVTTDGGDIPLGKTASLLIKKGREVQHEQFGQFSRLLHDSLSKRLLQERIFVSVVDSTEPADYQMIVSVERWRAGSYSYWRGNKRGVVETGVSLVDSATNEEIKLFNATGVGSRNIFSPQAYGADDPLHEVIEQIIETLGGEPEPKS